MRCIILALFLVAAWPVSASDDAEDCLVLILGDSLSAAYGMEQSESWPALLSGRLQQDGYRCRVFNSSITGDTTQGGLARLPRLLEAHHPDAVIIELGGNDGLRGLPLDVTESNLRSMITLSHEAGANIILAGVQLPPNYGRTYTERFRAMYPELAEEFGIALIPFILEGVALDPELMQDDGIHPNARAQPRILDIVWQRLRPLLH
ncbi:arylesterase [Elongatibacter sediminis]|uniref:Arylesterase n=1 Tax=Elongatibacter sediminis TaxID=3119006 RepID=A0AAW9RCR3_9GAMM